jgi:uncharacterized protein (TIGR00251 family)
MLVEIKVIPRSSRNLIKDEGGRLKAYLTIAPEKGKANKVLVELLAGHFNVKKSCVRIVKGEHSHHKIIEITA